MLNLLEQDGIPLDRLLDGIAFYLMNLIRRFRDRGIYGIEDRDAVAVFFPDYLTGILTDEVLIDREVFVTIAGPLPNRLAYQEPVPEESLMDVGLEG